MRAVFNMLGQFVLEPDGMAKKIGQLELIVKSKCHLASEWHTLSGMLGYSDRHGQTQVLLCNSSTRHYLRAPECLGARAAEFGSGFGEPACPAL